MSDQNRMIAIFKLDGCVLIQRVGEDATDMGLMTVPPPLKQRRVEADIVAIGPGASSGGGEIHPFSVHVGDRVRLRDWSGTLGTRVRVDGKELVITKEADLMRVIDYAASKKN